MVPRATMARRAPETSTPRIDSLKSAMPDSIAARRRFAVFILALLALSCRSSRYTKIDVHSHLAPETIPRAIELMDLNGIAAPVNLSGAVPGRVLEQRVRARAKEPGRVLGSQGL